MGRVKRGVKHLNPRQGITTGFLRKSGDVGVGIGGVKHLNPRQGITTSIPNLRRWGSSV